ncbi:MAG: phosphatidylinositol transfer protein [Myxococcales bacterium]|nr:phosphatidylinositol transfer protein [Myxococcales bacterium]
MRHRLVFLALSLGWISCSSTDSRDTDAGSDTATLTTSAASDASSDSTAGTLGSSGDSSGDATSGDTASTSSEPTTGDSDPTTGDSEPTTSDSDATTDDTDTATDTDDPFEPVPGALCDPVPSCEAALPGDLDIKEALNHRGRDMFYVEGEDQWVLAKFAEFGILDFDLHEEEVSIYLLRGCVGDWEFLGTAYTSNDGDNPTVEGVEDTGGRIYFKIPQDKALAPGRHRVHMIVESENSRADQYIDVVPAGAPIFVSDIDGTLTTAEFEEFADLLIGDIPDANPFAAEALTLLAGKGYRPMYVTARPEFLYKRSREFVRLRGFPNGIIHTTLSKDGALGGEAITYKTEELARLANKGLVPTFVFGNTDSDAQAYENGQIEPLDHRVFFQYTDAFGGRRIESYQELLAEFAALPDLCEP